MGVWLADMNQDNNQEILLRNLMLEMLASGMVKGFLVPATGYMTGMILMDAAVINIVTIDQKLSNTYLD